MKKNNSIRIITILEGLCALIAIFCMFATAFNEDGGSVRGNLFTICFPDANSGYNYVWPLIIAFVLLILVFLGSLFTFFFKSEKGKPLAVGLGVVSLVSGVLFLLSPMFYEMANGIDLSTTGFTSVGAGSIATAVFAFLGTALALLTLLIHNNEGEVRKTGIKKAH